MNLDFVSDMMTKAIPNVSLIGFPDTGFFLDGRAFEVSKDWY
jgi:hypothetical protein